VIESWIAVGAIALGTLALGLVAYWALVITEGAYLGRRVVTWLYDHTPGYYDRIKTITWLEDDEWLIEPLLRRLEGIKRPLVLDVGTGTGRLPLALLADGRFEGQVWGLDLSLGMLKQARIRLARFGARCRLIEHNAHALPFPEAAFDAVTCLEMVEFTPHPRHTVSELVRVLRPGGVLLFSNRIGRARWFPGRTFNDDALVELLGQYPLQDVQIHNWNSFYDLVWTRKVGQPSSQGRGADGLQDWLIGPEAYFDAGGIVRHKRQRGPQSQT
jgi:ubiquinone/menaquinone biosynthesis C-methylase UbiE